MYDFMPHIERFRQDPEPGIDYDLIVVGDCGDLERVGSVLGRHAELFGRVPIVNIDHHISNAGFGAVDWIDPSAAATCEMVTLLMPALGLSLDAADGAIAANLMAGVVIDTANFQHPNVTPRTLRVAAELRRRRRAAVRHGAAASTAPSRTGSSSCSALVLARLRAGSRRPAGVGVAVRGATTRPPAPRSRTPRA